MTSRYCVGIDLGTTNSAVAYFDLTNRSQKIQLLKIPQLTHQGFVEALPLLPSCIFLDGGGEIRFGTFAKMQGAAIPTKLIQSAKSWLIHGAAFRKEKILPFDAPLKFRTYSPVEAATALLIHIKEAWNQQIAKGDLTLTLEQQSIILTTPASFDEIARRLTLEAASLAGLKNIALLEEPQAAFYNWLMEHSTSHFCPNDLILICDLGGGTCDFSLIEAKQGENGVELQRMAVGKHLLLGGDNMDGALAHYLEKKIAQSLDRTQQLILLQQARLAKEHLLKSELKGEESYTLLIPGTGSKVVGGSISVSLSKTEVDDILLEGFFPVLNFNEAILLKRGSGIRQMGLPYETEPAITKHLADFLYRGGCDKKPDYLLFNGGAFHPQSFQKRIVESLNCWFLEETEIKTLHSSSLDLAVAKGAAYLGRLRVDGGACIEGGIPRSFYLGLDSTKSVTLIPRGSREGSKIVSSQKFSLIPNQPVSFHLYYSNTRLNDHEGDIVEINEEDFTQLPPIHTRCTFGKKESKEPLPVVLEVELTLIGTLELWLRAQNTPHQWRLEFQLRGENYEERAFEIRFSGETIDTQTLTRAKNEVQEAFALTSHANLNQLMPKMEQWLEMKRHLWPPLLLRGLFESLMEHSSKRLLSSEYESRFWNLAGFFLRPGLGYPLDELRVKQLWKIILADLKKPKNEESLIQHWICYRRIAAGLVKGAQNQLFNEILHTTSKNKAKKRGYFYAEQMRALASFEFVECTAKIGLGNKILKKITSGEGESCDFWALARLGARELFYGTAANVIDSKICEEWVLQLLDSPYAQNDHLPFTLLMLARKTENRTLDLSPGLLERITPLLPADKDLLLHERPLSFHEQERLFGDSLPPGLLLLNESLHFSDQIEWNRKNLSLKGERVL